MRASVPRLVRILPRSQLAVEHPTIPKPLSGPLRSDIKKPTLIELLIKRKTEAGADYPSNIRIEPVLTKRTFKDVRPEFRQELKELLKER